MRSVRGSSGRREEKRLQTHRRIFDEAMRLFRERGFDSVSVGDIAKAAGISAPTFYAHFESKDHLILALPTPEDVEQLLLAQPAELAPADRVRAGMISSLVDIDAEARERVLDRWRIIVASPALRVRAAEFERKTAEMALQALPDREPGTDPAGAIDVTVTALFSAYTQILLRWAESDGKRPVEDVVEEVLRALRGLSH